MPGDLLSMTVKPSNTDVELDQYACGMQGFYTHFAEGGKYCIEVEVEACGLLCNWFCILQPMLSLLLYIYENVTRAEAEKQEPLGLAAPASLHG